MAIDPELCLSCGACCAHYRVSFHWSEAGQRGLNEAALIQVPPWRVCLRGTENHPVRCHYLEGVVGEQTGCRIYAQRPSPCREVTPGDNKCLQARAAHGLDVSIFETEDRTKE